MLYDNIKTRWVMEGGEGMMMMGAVLVHTGISTTYKNEFTPRKVGGVGGWYLVWWVRVKREKRSFCVLCVVQSCMMRESYVYSLTFLRAPTR